MDEEFWDISLEARAETWLKKGAELKKMLSEGKTLSDVLDIPKEELAKGYKKATQLFEEKQYREAGDLFLFLTTLDALCHDYWLGLGMSRQLLGQFEEAIDAYEMAATCELESPVPYFYLAKCFFAIHDRESALEALNLALEYAKGNPDFTNLQDQALSAKKKLLEQHG